MQITRNSLDTNPGPSDWFTGSVFIDAVAAPSDESAVGAASVHFTPGALTAWHTHHPHGQTIWVTEEVGLCQRRGGPIEGNVVTWADHVTDDEYAQAPEVNN